MADIPSQLPSQLTDAERDLGRRVAAELNQHNIFCHCRQCDREWVASRPEVCACGSPSVEFIACWQFPDG